jgi:hypothetical protein
VVAFVVVFIGFIRYLPVFLRVLAPSDSKTFFVLAKIKLYNEKLTHLILVWAHATHKE